MKFEQLHAGDRFRRSGKGDLWTKIDPGTARRHSNESRALGGRGYGYIGDGICSFERDDEVDFVPVSDNAVMPPLTGRWHHGNGALVCGTIRIAMADFDTNPPKQFQNEMFGWMCEVLNKTTAEVMAARSDPFAHELM